jgi:hypothetical protein
MDFKTAIEQLSAGRSYDDIAAAADVPSEVLRAAAAGSGEPPEEWERTLARVARERAQELVALADELDPVELDPKWESAYG